MVFKKIYDIFNFPDSTRIRMNFELIVLCMEFVYILYSNPKKFTTQKAIIFILFAYISLLFYNSMIQDISKK